MRHPAGETAPWQRGGKAAWTLILLAPVCGELTFSAVGMPPMWLAFPLLVPMYGAGVLLIRELTVRVGGGWPTLLVLGLAYELAEDGLGLQALTSPTMYNAAEWGSRVLGVNLTYWETQVGYHVAFSVFIPVVLTNLLFPELRDEPYLRRRGLVGTAFTAVVGIGLLQLMFAGSVDPGYQAPVPFLIGLLAVMAALAFVALRVLPGRRGSTPSPHTDLAVPRARVAGLIAAAATLVFLGLLMPPGDPPRGPVIGEGAFAYVLMAVTAVLAITILVLISRWSNSRAMTDRHRIWLAGGALVSHTLFVVVMALVTPKDTLTTVLAVTTGPAVIVATVVLLAWLARHVDARTRTPQADPNQHQTRASG